MIKAAYLCLALALSVLVYLVKPDSRRGVEQPSAWVEVQNEAIELWVPFPGTVESRDQQTISSSLSNRAAITELAEEGKIVQAGEVVVQFDRLGLQREFVQMEEAFVLAETEVQALELAEHPLQLAELKWKLKQLEGQQEIERQYLADTEKLRAKDLVSEQEIKKQQAQVDQLGEQVTLQSNRLKLTEKFLQPSALRRAKAALSSATQQRDLASTQLKQATVVAERPGMVVYQPLHIDGEYRTVRVGDAVFRNQKFMMLADMSNLVVRCEIPEAQLSNMQVQNRCEVVPAAFPNLTLPGVVEQIGTMAHTLSGQPTWQKYFTVTLRLENHDPRLRSGMSVAVRVLAYHKRQSLLVPRTSISWDGGVAHCRKKVGKKVETVVIETGRGNATHLEVISGLALGDVIAR